MAALGPIFELMRLRAGPQDMAGDRTTLFVAVAIYVVAGASQLFMLKSAPEAVSLALLTAVLLAIYTAALLLWRNTPNRFRQTATALFASGAIFSVIMLGPDIAMAPYLEKAQNAAEAEQSTNQKPPTTAINTTSDANGVADSNKRQSESSSNASGNPSDNLPMPSLWALVFVMAIGVWRLMVFSNIYRQALDVSRWLGLAATLGFEFFLLAVFTVV